MQFSKEDKQFLELYSDSNYKKPSVTIDAVIFRMVDKQCDNYRKLPEKKMQVYLTRRNYPPFKDSYGIVGTFIDLNYTLTETMQLCVKKKVGLNNAYKEQLYTFGEKQRDPRTRVLSVSYMLLADNKEKLINGKWFDITIETIKNHTTSKDDGYKIEKEIKIILSNDEEKLENLIRVTLNNHELDMNKEVEIISSELAFDHIKIIYYALERLRNKLEYTDIAFHLLPKKFTLTELKNCYEEILGKKLLDANFRRKTASLVLPLNEYTSDKGHRPSQLYKHNPNWDMQ